MTANSGGASETGHPLLTEIARDALLHYLDRGDARQALALALGALSLHQGATCGLQALAPDGQPRWQEGLAAGHPLPVAELGRELGRLWLPLPMVYGELAPLLPTLASLLNHDAQAGGAAVQRVDTPTSLLRAALAGTDTFAWEWNLDSDWLGDIDEGLRLLGWQRHEVGHTQEDWNRLIHPDDLAANDIAYQRHAAGETELYEHAYRARHKNGQWRWMLERGRIVERHPDGRARRMVGTQVDITERRAAERQASEAVQRLEQIARQVPGMLYMYEQQRGQIGQLRYASERGAQLFGLMTDDALRDMGAVWALIPDEDRQRMQQALSESARTLCEWRCDFRVRRPDGDLRFMAANATPERLADDLTRWYGYVEDVTERVQLEQARRDAALASAANRAKTEFLSRISHELRTPLNAVLGFTQLMEIDHADPPSAGQLRRLSLVREAGEHLLRMIGDLLDLTRIESGGLSLKLEPVPMFEVAAQTLEMMRSAADAAQVQLRLLPGGETLRVRADRTRLRQVLLNLLSNAIKYNRAGGSVSVQVQVPVQADGTPEQAEVHIIVSDTGHGIAEADLPFVFEPFNRGQQAHGAVEGTGIGLSVTRALVELMQGLVLADSRLGEGSSFRVCLPRDGGMPTLAQLPT